MSIFKHKLKTQLNQNANEIDIDAAVAGAAVAGADTAGIAVAAIAAGAAGAAIRVASAIRPADAGAVPLLSMLLPTMLLLMLLLLVVIV